MKLHYNFDELNKFIENITYASDSALMTATQRIAKELHKMLLSQTPIDTGNLRKMWSAGDNLRFTVKRVTNGFEVTFVNAAQNEKGEKYGEWVNDGHKTPNGEGWVTGRFFVENSIDLTYPKIERIVMAELKKHLGGVYT